MMNPVKAMWFVGLNGTNSNPSPVAHAFGAFAKLFKPDLDVSENALECARHGEGLLIHASQLIEAISKREQKTMPVWVLGTVTLEEAVQQSWHDLGLNLFELPLGSQQNQRVFRYVPINSLLIPLHPQSWGVKLFDPVEANDWIQAKEHLQWAKCHEMIREIQRSFGHGNRDVMQFQGVEQAKKAIQRERRDNFQEENLPCANCVVKAALEEIKIGITPDTLQSSLRAVANLDCQTYRLASLLNLSLDETTSYKRIIILEDHRLMRKHLKQKLKEKYGSNVIQIADIDKSLKKWTFCKKNGADIKLTDDEEDNGWDTLVCLDLEIGPRENTYGIAGGLWFLYHTALHYPFASRLVITGYRKQDLNSFNAGAGAFLLKPFSDNELYDAIEASQPFSALWICPDSARKDWEQWASNLEPPKNYGWLKNQLAAWLRKFHIRLETAPNYDESKVNKHSVVILDYYEIQHEHDHVIQETAQTFRHTQETLIKDYLKIKSANPAANIIIILPMRDDIFQTSGVLHALGRILRDGPDVIAHKPIWLYSEHREEPGLGQIILTTLKNRPMFDVKYVVFTPVMGLVWPKAKKFIELQAKLIAEHKEKSSDTEKNNLNPVVGWSPMGVLMGERWGFGYSFEDILSNPQLEIEQLEIELSEKLDKERKRNEQRWQTVSEAISSKELVDQFLTYLRHSGNDIASHLTIERWLRAVLDDVFKVVGQSFLIHLFGGETRYEFGARGGWYDDKGIFVQDIPLVIEFCAKKGILAREAIEQVIVNFLKKKGGEQCVLLQEVPIRGFQR